MPMDISRPGPPSRTDWLRLDNAAKIYPASVKDATPPVFRLTASFRQPIRIQPLQDAVDAISQRTPYYQVYLKPGVFWYYLEQHSRRTLIQPLSDETIGTIPLGRRNQQLIQISARSNTVAIDFSHVLTDGYGGMIFLSSVIAEYLRRLGHDITVEEPFLSPDEPPAADEYVDAYQQIFEKAATKSENQKPAYHIGGTPSDRYRLITATMPISDVLQVSRGYGVTLTEYLVAAKINAVADIYKEHRSSLFRPKSSIARIEVPVNMRRLFPSKTMRNFSLFVAPEVDLGLGACEFAGILKAVHHQMNLQLDRNQLLRQVARNVGGERNALVRAIPRPIKYAYLSYLKRTIGNRTHSGVVSNLGRFLLPPDAVPHVDSVRFVLGPNHAFKAGCSVVSFGDHLNVTIGSVLENRALERSFFRRFTTDGIHVAVREE